MLWTVCDLLHISCHQILGIVWLPIGLGILSMSLEVLSLENESSLRENILTLGVLLKKSPKELP